MIDTGDDWQPPYADVWHPDPIDIKYAPAENTQFKPGKSAFAPKRIIRIEDAGTGLVKTWSASGLKDYETCPYRVKLAKVDKVEREKHPAATRGTAIHDIAEKYVMGEDAELSEETTRFLPEWETKIFPKFKERFEALREKYADGKVELEGEWAFTKEWGVTGWSVPDTWARMKLDVLEHESETSAKIIDHKTGRKFGNEVTHAGQGMIYAIGTFMRYPKLEFLETNFWYLDHDKDMPQRYTREQAMVFLPRVTSRAVIMTSDKQMEPKPSIHNCKWCPFNKNETCDWRQNG